MTYNMMTFILFFLPLSILAYYLSPNKIKKLVLCIISVIFYAISDIKYIVLVLFLVLANYYFDLLYTVYKKKYKNDKKFFVFILFYNILLLVFFKINEMPLGFSFIIFNILSFHIDVYRKKIGFKRTLFDFIIYILFFGKILQGPLVRYDSFIKKYKFNKINIDNIVHAIELFIKGLFLKEVISANLVVCLDFINNGPYCYFSIVLHEVIYLINLYIDFYSYSIMAIGIAKLFCLEIPLNFNYPLFATSMTDFWRKWHISLSFWFRDYVYIPLGGNRAGIFRNIINILVVWAVTGLWHGFSINFILWGLANFVVLIIEKFIFRNKLDKILILNHIWTIIIAVLVFVLFQYNNTTDIVDTYKYLFFIKSIDITNDYLFGIIDNYKIWIVISVVLCTPLINYLYDKLKKNSYIMYVIINIVLLIISFVYIVSNNYTPFIYVKF